MNNALDLVRIKLQVDKQLLSENAISRPHHALEILKNEIFDLDREVVVLLNLNIKNQVINASIATVGTINASILNPKEIFKTALLSNATSMILMHNHPSGDVTASKADYDITETIATLGKMMQITLLDHIIVSPNGNIKSLKEEKPELFYKEPILKMGENLNAEINRVLEEESEYTEMMPEIVESVNELDVKKGADFGTLPKKEKTTPQHPLSKYEMQIVKEFYDFLLSNDSAVWEKGFIGIEEPHNPLSKIAYTGLNRLRLYMYLYKHKLNDPRFVTFKQANEAGWKIKSGAKAITINYKIPYDKETEKPVDPQSLSHLTPVELKEYYDHHVFWKEKYYNVFHAKDIENIPEYTIINKELNDVEKEAFMNRCIQNSGVAFLEDATTRSAYYIPKEDTIVMPPRNLFKNNNFYFGTLLHEFAHATGHETRNNRTLNTDNETSEYALEEIIAEFTSLFILNQLGLEKNKNKKMSFEYIKHYFSQIENADYKLLYALKQSIAAKEYILQVGEYEKYLQSEPIQQEFPIEKSDEITEENMEKENNVIFFNITEKQILKTITKKSQKDANKTYEMNLVIISHGEYKGKAIWVFSNQLKKHTDQKRLAEGVVQWSVRLDKDKPLKLYDYEKNDKQKYVIANKIEVLDIQSFVDDIKAAKMMEYKKHTQSNEKEDTQIEDLER